MPPDRGKQEPDAGKETESMAHYLVIVESPTKVKTIRKFLSSSYKVMASAGHVRDLPKSQLGFDAEHDYEPKYITIRGKGDVLAALRKEARKADKVYLATDPDREGEAISWHLVAALKLDPEKTFRITFNEITKTAVKEALKHPRQIDMDMVDAQQTRRILDRMVGYRISPLLWAKIKRGLSAGRVQSVALRIISDREAEIAEFIPQEYWTIDAELRPHGAKKNLTAQYHGTGSGKELPENSDRTLEIEKALRDAVFTVTSVKKGERTRKAPLPFTTSTLQQEAAKALNFSTQKTMRVAQQLYEGVRIKGEGTVGLITYLRTDSTRISKEAAAAASAYISEQYGPQYAAPQSKAQPSGGSAEGGQRIQDAHEAIRPTDIRRLPSAIKEELTREDYDAMPYINADGYHSKNIAYSIWHIFRIEDIVAHTLYSIWHIFRIEDIVAHTLVARDEQIFFTGGFQKRIKSPIITTGNELIKEQISDFSKQLDIDELYAYIQEVKKSTEEIVKGLSYDMLKQKVSEDRKNSLISQNVVSTDEEAYWLIDYWCGKDIRGLIQMPFSRHWIMHIEACLRIKDKIRH